MFEDRLKRLREARHLSQREVAEDLGIPQTTYSGYENNNKESQIQLYSLKLVHTLVYH